MKNIIISVTFFLMTTFLGAQSISVPKPKPLGKSYPKTLKQSFNIPNEGHSTCMGWYVRTVANDSISTTAYPASSLYYLVGGTHFPVSTDTIESISNFFSIVTKAGDTVRVSRDFSGVNVSFPEGDAFDSSKGYMLHPLDAVAGNDIYPCDPVPLRDREAIVVEGLAEGRDSINEGLVMVRLIGNAVFTDGRFFLEIPLQYRVSRIAKDLCGARVMRMGSKRVIGLVDRLLTREDRYGKVVSVFLTLRTLNE